MSLAIGWEKFCYAQVIGFALLLTGTLIYNAVVRVPGLQYDFAETVAESADADDAAAGLLGFAEGGDVDYRALTADASRINAFPVRAMRKS